MELLDFPQYRTVSSRQSGSFVSSFASHAGDFQEIREYQPGDNIARIDWAKTLSRWSDPLVRSYQDEVDRSLEIFVDISPTLRFSDGVSSKLDCLIGSLHLLIRSSWVRQMSGTLTYVIQGSLFQTPLPTNLVTLDAALAKLKKTVLSSSARETGVLTKSLALRSPQDAFVFVMTDDPESISQKILGEISRQNLAYLVSIHHPFEEVIAENYEFVASDGIKSRDVAIDASPHKDIRTRSWVSGVQSIALDCTKDVFLPFAHAFAHPIWKA